MKSNVVAIVQARMGASRLWGKVLMALGNTTTLGQVVKRLLRCATLDKVVVATTTRTIDALVEDEANRLGVDVFRGSESNVLARYYLAAKEYNASTIVRVTADCPLVDPALLNQMLQKFASMSKQGRNVDYLSNTQTRSYPRGLDIEILTIDALARTYKEARAPEELEHVTPYIWKNRGIFNIEQYVSDHDHSNFRWTLDTKEDYEFLSKVFESLEPKNNNFTTDDVMFLLACQPELVDINAKVKQKPVTMSKSAGL